MGVILRIFEVNCFSCRRLAETTRAEVSKVAKRAARAAAHQQQQQQQRHLRNSGSAAAAAAKRLSLDSGLPMFRAESMPGIAHPMFNAFQATKKCS